jgi:hypothetical protein
MTGIGGHECPHGAHEHQEAQREGSDNSKKRTGMGRAAGEWP